MKIVDEALTFDDVLLIPGKAEFHPNDADVTSKLTARISLKIPLLSAAMDTVTESKAAITMAQEGGIGVIHKNLSVEDQVLEVQKVKKSEWGMIIDPITITEGATLGEVHEIMRSYKISGVPVVEGVGQKKKLRGIITNRDLRFETDLTRKVSERMTKQPLYTAPEGTSLQQAAEILRDNRVEKLPVVDGQGYLVGLITIKDIEKQRAFPNANKDGFGRLIVGAAVGVGESGMERAGALYEVGVDALFIDSAHGHSQGVCDAIKEMKIKFGKKVDIIGGNIATYEGAKELIDCGADAIKVGMGPGSICTTRVVAGIGVPQLYAIREASRAAKAAGIPVIADGGVKYSGDITKALASGADSVMLGSLFAGTDESPGEVIIYQGRSYKVYRGMGSLGAMSHGKGARERYFQSEVEEMNKMVAEGIEGRVPYRGSLAFNVQQMIGGLRAGMGYCGCKTIERLHADARFVKITGSGLHESHPHDVMVTKEAPNYRLK